MHRSLIFQAAFVCASVVWVFALQGKQKRRELDEQLMREAKQGFSMDAAVTP